MYISYNLIDGFYLYKQITIKIKSDFQVNFTFHFKKLFYRITL